MGNPASTDTLTVRGEYAITFRLTDITSGASEEVAVGSLLSGTLTTTSANVRSLVDENTAQSLRLGDTIYTVTLGLFTPPGPPAPSGTNLGFVRAHVEVSPADMQESPEPSSLVLAGLGVAAACGAGLRRIRRTRRPTPAA